MKPNNYGHKWLLVPREFDLCFDQTHVHTGLYELLTLTLGDIFREL